MCASSSLRKSCAVLGAITALGEKIGTHFMGYNESQGKGGACAHHETKNRVDTHVPEDTAGPEATDIIT